MNDPAQERIDEYLDMVDAAETNDWFPGTYDEWKAVKAQMGITIPRGLDGYCQYSTERVRHAERTGRAAAQEAEAGGVNGMKFKFIEGAQ